MPAGSFDAAGLSRIQLAELARDLKIVAPETRKRLPGALRKAVQPIVVAARANAAQVSPGNPIKIGVRTRFTGRNGASVKIIGTSPTKPALAGLLERGSESLGEKAIKHPGGKSQPTQPYLQPAYDAHQDEALRGTSEVITEVLAVMKFR